MAKLYKYVGESDILELTKNVPEGKHISNPADVIDWINDTNQVPESDGLYWATFTVSEERKLYIADRRSEHVACANGKAVISAGEVAFFIDNKKSEIIEISNQSTGYCPEPESWHRIKDIFGGAEIPSPSEFTFKVIFRLCEKCGERNIVRDSHFICACCEAELSEVWNF